MNLVILRFHAQVLAARSKKSIAGVVRSASWKIIGPELLEVRPNLGEREDGSDDG